MKKILLLLSLTLAITITGFWSCSKKQEETVRQNNSGLIQLHHLWELAIVEPNQPGVMIL